MCIKIDTLLYALWFITPPFTMPILRLYSKLYMEVEDDSWSARPNISCMHELPRHEDTGRWIAHIRSGDSQLHIALGDPVANTAQNPAGLYLPSWAIEALSLQGAGDEVQVNFVRCEEFEKATSLTFQVLGGPVDEGMLRDILEESLSSLGVLEEGQMIPLPMMEGVVLLVSACEPVTGAVLLDGHEVALHIQQSRPSTPEALPPVPVPVPVPQEHEEHEEHQEQQAPESTSMIPPSFAGVSSNANVTNNRFRRHQATTPSFVAFSGLGRTLGNS
jgi:hypothetical protein